MYKRQDRQKACVHLAGKCLQDQLLSAIAMGKPGADILVQLLQPHTIEHGKRQHLLRDSDVPLCLLKAQLALYKAKVQEAVSDVTKHVA